MPPAKPVEASTLSKSQSSVSGTQQRKELIAGKSSFVDLVFPMCDEMLKNTYVPDFLYYILFLILIIQIMSVSFWLQLPDFKDRTSVAGSILQYFWMMSFFSNLEMTQEQMTTRFIITTVITFLYFAILIVQAIIYQNQRRFIRWTLFVTRFFIEFIPIICLCPLGNFIGQNVYIMVRDSPMYSIIYFVFNLIYLCCFLFAHYMMSYLFAASTYLSTAPTACWSGPFHFIYIVGVSLFPLFAYVLQSFVNWILYVLIIAKIAFNVYICWNTTFLPFVHYHTNTIIASLFTALFPMDIMAFIQMTGYKIATHYKFLAFVVTFVVSFFIWRIITNSIVKKVKYNLSKFALEVIEPTEDAMAPTSNKDNYMFLSDPVKRQHYMNCRLDTSSLKSELYLRIGISNHCPLFLDWSIAKFIAEYHNSAGMLCLITQLIAFFPCESRLLNYFFTMVTMKTSLRVEQRFMIYQIHRVKGLRQSSASSEITDMLMEMKAKSLQGINDVRNFWNNPSQDPSFLYNIRKMTLSTGSLFSEAIEKWPNNCRMCEDYSNFLIECATNFTDGLKMKHRSELIEQGKNFVVDLSYRSLVRAYPYYLKGGITDVKGNFIDKPAGNTLPGNRSQSSSNSNNSQISSGTMDGELDLEIEEQLAKASFSFHRLRLAYQRALQHRKSTNNNRLKSLSVFSMLLGVVGIVFLYVWYYSIFTTRETNMQHQLLLNRFRYGFDAAVATVVTHWAHKKTFISSKLLGNETSGLSMKSPKSNNNNLQFSGYRHVYNPSYGVSETDFYMLDEIQRWIMFSKDNLEDFISAVIELASSGSNVHKIMESMVSRVVQIDFCDGDQNSVRPIGNPVNETLKTALLYGLLKIGNLTQVRFSDANDWQVNKGLCECIANVQAMYKAFDSLTVTIADDQTVLRDDTRAQNFMIMAILCSIFFVAIEAMLNTTLYMTIHELKALLTTMSEIDKQSRETAATPFKKMSTEDQETLNQTSTRTTISPLFLYSNVVIFGLFAVALFIAMILISEDKNQAFSSLNQWLFYGISRGNYMLEAIVFAILDVFVTQMPGVTTMISNETAYSLASSILGTLVEYNNYILRGKSDGQIIKPCIGQNARLDQIHFSDDCHGNLNLGGFHDTYRCASLDRGITLFTVLVSEMIAQPNNVSLELDSTFYHAFHLMNDHLMDPSYEAATILSQLAKEAVGKFHTLITAIAFGGIAILLVVFILFFYNLSRLDVAFAGALQLLRRLPPLSIVSNLPLMNYLLNKKTEKTTGKMTVSKLVLMNAKDAVICLNKNESIEVVNKAVTAIFGYTPEQLLGQPISTILSEDENQKLFEQFGFMRSGECPLTFESSCKGVTDDEQTMPVHLNLLGITDDNSKIAKSFVIIMSDETTLLRQQEEAEKAKKKSEDLLYQILPRDIVNRLNHGETDISFTVPSGSVVFVDIVKFSEYSSSLSPAQIMESLSMVFACFDNIIAKYTLMTKIKLIGDVYMAAANLFTPEEPVTNHASQVVQFGLDVLCGLDDVNAQLDSNLSVRIGINTDGPLIAGVLGTDKPVFDIIGDTINVAARLQSNGIPGTVQISQSTYDAIATLNFNVEERGFINLKGKGKKMAYIVRPADQSSFFANSMPEMPPMAANPPPQNP